MPSATKAVLEGLGSAAGGAIGARLTLAPLAKLETMAAQGGIPAHVADVTRSAIYGSDKAHLTATTSRFGANVGEAVNAGIEVAKEKFEKLDKP